VDQDYKELQKGEMVISASGGDYTIVPDGEMLKVHVGKTSTVLTDNFEKTEKVNKLVVPFVLDEEVEGKGQVYTSWFTPSLNEKSNLAKLLAAVYGKIPTEVDPVELEGKSLRITLVNKEKDGAIRQYVDSFFKPDKDQKDVVLVQSKDVLVNDDEDITNLEEVFGPDVKEVS
jgi:hypothetical protein